MDHDLRSQQEDPPSTPLPGSVDAQFVFKALLSAAVLMAGFGFLLFGSGGASDTALAAGGIGLIFGHWMR